MISCAPTEATLHVQVRNGDIQVIAEPPSCLLKSTPQSLDVPFFFRWHLSSLWQLVDHQNLVALQRPCRDTGAMAGSSNAANDSYKAFCSE